MAKKRIVLFSYASLALFLLSLFIASPVLPVSAAGIGVDLSHITHSVYHATHFSIDSVADDNIPVTQVQGLNIQSIATPRNQHIPGDAQVSTVPYFKSSFTYNGTTYPYRMVGTDPARGSGITVVPALLFPLKLVFADGSVFDSTPLVPTIANSPVFRPGHFDSGYTQYSDVIQRDEFWNDVSTRSYFYHVFLAGPFVLPTITLHVPASQGTVQISSANGKKVGIPSFDFMDQAVHDLFVQYHISPRVLPIFLTGDVFPGDAFGYHGAFLSTNQKQLFTYIVTNWLSKGITGHEADEDASTVTHEVSEWVNDPFALDNSTGNKTGIDINITPEWYTDGYGCQNVLEVGDPVYIYAFRYEGYKDFIYHLQDIVFFSWFARQVPSTALGGRYTYMNTFTTPSTDCPPGTSTTGKK